MKCLYENECTQPYKNLCCYKCDMNLDIDIKDNVGDYYIGKDMEEHE